MVGQKVLALFVAVVGLIVGSMTLPTPSKQRDDAPLLFSHPLLLRALTGPSHTLMADWLWLQLGSVDETGAQDSYHVDLEALIRATRTIGALDERFTVPVLYTATYLATIPHDIEGAKELLDEAIARYPSSLNLIMTEVFLLATYSNHYDGLIAKRVKQAALLPGARRYGKINVEGWLEEFLVAARVAQNRRAQAIEDLRWLLKVTTDPKRKKIIAMHLKELEEANTTNNN
ncbi:MAG: hypothetical protein K6347_03945 [Campylobacterales bacterium]